MTKLLQLTTRPINIDALLWRLLVWVPITVFAALAFGAVVTLPHMGIIICLLFGLALFLSIAMLIGLPRRIGNAIRWPTLRACAAAGGETGAILFVMFLYSRWLYPPEMTLDLERCETIVRAIESGKLLERPPGIVDLPPDLADATFDGQLFVTRVPATRLYLFKTMQKPLRAVQAFRGYVYSTAPLDSVPMKTTSNGVRFFDANAWSEASNHPPLSLTLVPRPTTSNHWLPVSSFEMRDAPR